MIKNILDLFGKIKYNDRQKKVVSKLSKGDRSMAKIKTRADRHRRLLIAVGILIIVMATAITFTSVRVLVTQIRSDRENVVTGSAKLASEIVNGDMVSQWLTQGKDDEYEKTFNTLAEIVKDTPHLQYIYVYQILEDGCHVVFDPDPETGCELGELVEFDESFEPLIPTLLAGGNIDIMESNDSYGWLLTDYEPIFDSNGNCVAYAGADISLDEVHDYTVKYVTNIVAIAVVSLLICVFIGAKMSISNQKAGEVELLLEQQKRDKELMREIIEAFAKVVDLKDSYTQGHSFRVAKYTQMLARELGYDEESVEKYYNIALLHDIGKIGVPDNVLNKPGKLTDEEYDLIKSHAARGYDVLKSISLMPEIAIGAEFHHERPDGKGYPNGLKGDEIPMVAQIIGVADCFDAMYSNRPYRARMNFDRVVSIIEDVSGTQLSSEVVEAFLRLVEKGELRAPDDDGGGTFEDISNIRSKQEET